MKIVFVNSLYSPNFVGGAERSVQALAEGLTELGASVTVISTADQKANTEATVNGVRVHYLGYKNRYWTYEDHAGGKLSKAVWHARDSYNTGMASEVQKVVAREAPDVVHTNILAGMSVAVWDTVHELNVPIVHTLRDYYLMCPSSTMFRRGRSCDRPCAGCSLFGAVRKKASRHVAAVAGVSEFILRKHLRFGYFPNATIAQGVRTGHDPKPGSIVSRVPREDGRLVVGFLGCISPNKGIEVLLDAVKSFPHARIQCQVAGSGKSDYQQHLRDRFRSPNIAFLGQTPAAQFLESIDVLVVASLWEEPLARVIIEALSHGTPVITTPRGGSTEVVKNGVNGIVCKDDSVASMSDALRTLLDDPEYLVNLRRNITLHTEVNTVRMMTERYLAIYQSVSRANAIPVPHKPALSPIALDLH